MPENKEKYKALYEYHKDQFNSECSRFDRLEDKAVKYLGAITVAISAYVLLVRWSADKVIPPNDFISCLTTISIGITFIAMASAWGFIFKSIQLQDLMKMPHGNTINEYFHNNSQETVLIGLSKKYSEATSAKEKQYKLKLFNVKKGYENIVFSGWCFLVSVTLIFSTVWVKG